MGSISQSSLVLLTGTTGHIGFKTLLLALEAGYRVRAAVRSDAKKNVILSNAAFQKLSIRPEQLTFVQVPDLTAPGAYDAAVQGVDYIIHIASPIATDDRVSSEDYEQYFIAPAVQGTVGMLESAMAHGHSMKRVVITSSAVAIMPFEKLMGGHEPNEVYDSESRTPVPKGLFSNEFAAYSASKVAALNASEQFMREKKPAFDLVNILPSFVEGRNELVFSTKAAMSGSNAVVLSVVAGVQAAIPLPGATVHNDDIARLHVEALDESKIPAGSYMGHSNNPHGTLQGSHWEEINEIVARNFPEAIESGLISNSGRQTHVPIRIDATKTEKTFGWKLQGLEEQVISVVGQYVELAEKERAALK